MAKRYKEKINMYCDNCGRKYVVDKPDDMPEDAIAEGWTDCQNCEYIDPFMDDSFSFWIYDEDRIKGYENLSK